MHRMEGYTLRTLLAYDTQIKLPLYARHKVISEKDNPVAHLM